MSQNVNDNINLGPYDFRNAENTDRIVRNLLYVTEYKCI